MPDYVAARRQFAANTKNHRMTVLHDDGLYRHLHFAEPGTGIWSWSIVTWPGHLATVGDVANGYQFARLDDMLDFFRRGDESYINDSYWAEKMPPTIATKTYSPELFKQIVAEQAAEWEADLSTADVACLRSHLREELLENDYANLEWEGEARAAIERYRWTDSTGREHCFADSWEHDFREYDHHLILAMLAIRWGVARYDEWKASQELAPVAEGAEA